MLVTSNHIVIESLHNRKERSKISEEPPTSNQGQGKMIEYASLSQQPRIFKSLTGMTVCEFDDLCRRTRPVWQRNERERLIRCQTVNARSGRAGNTSLGSESNY